MKLVEILVILFCIGIVGGVFGNFIYKKIKHLPTGECACCQKRMNNLVKEYHKKYR